MAMLRDASDETDRASEDSRVVARLASCDSAPRARDVSVESAVLKVAVELHGQ